MKIIRDFFEECSIKDCLHEIDHALDELKNKRTKEINELRNILKEAKIKAKEIVKKEYKEYMRGFEVVDCHSCRGRGSKSKYVGLGCGDSYSDSPYILITCRDCRGEGIVRRVKPRKHKKERVI